MSDEEFRDEEKEFDPIDLKKGSLLDPDEELDVPLDDLEETDDEEEEDGFSAYEDDNENYAY